MKFWCQNDYIKDKHSFEFGLWYGDWEKKQRERNQRKNKKKSIKELESNKEEKIMVWILLPFLLEYFVRKLLNWNLFLFLFGFNWVN